VIRQTAFVALISAHTRRGCEILPPETCGVWVRCYIPAVDEEVAKEILFQRLEKDFLDLTEIDFLANYDSSDWEKADDGTDEQGVNECSKLGCLTYGTFWSFKHDAPDADCPH
jgi:hypothetical protein